MYEGNTVIIFIYVFGILNYDIVNNIWGEYEPHTLRFGLVTIYIEKSIRTNYNSTLIHVRTYIHNII